MRKICRILFSRYFISAIVILFEISFFTYIALYLTTYSVPIFVIMIIVNVASAVSIINRDVNPEYKASWLAVLIAAPFFGLVLYVLFYSRRVSKKDVLYIDKVYEKIRIESRESKNRAVLFELTLADPLAAGKARAIMNDDRLAKIYRDSSARIFTSGEEMFSSMMEALRSAEHYIFLEYFIIEQGKMWDEIHAVLSEKAQSGVRVRVLYDDIGSSATLPGKYPRVLLSEGIECLRFGKVNPRISTTHNNRDHRKILIVDGKCAYTGGINIADEYINEKKLYGHWKDGGICLHGSVVEGLLSLFLSTWDATARISSDYDKYARMITPVTSDGGYYIPFGSGPSPIYERPVGKNVFLNLINQAEKYLYITTPYLIIDYDLTESLRNAALRGVDVRIITPGIADKKKIKVMTKSSYPYLLSAGVKIYEYSAGFIHEKTMICDGKYAVIGTINLDYRSLVHHYENAVWMYRSPEIIIAHDAFLKTQMASTEQTAENSRLTVRELITRTLMRLFAPLL